MTLEAPNLQADIDTKTLPIDKQNTTKVPPQILQFSDLSK